MDLPPVGVLKADTRYPVNIPHRPEEGDEMIRCKNNNIYAGRLIRSWASPKIRLKENKVKDLPELGP